MSHAKVVITLTAGLMVVAMTSAQTPRQAVSTDTAAVQALTTEIRARNDLAAQAQRFSATELSALPNDQRRDFEGVMAEAKRQLAGQERLFSRRSWTRMKPSTR